MYYEYPEMEEAYTFNATQYFFGDNFVVSPITTPNDTATALTEQTVWIPEVPHSHVDHAHLVVTTPI